MNRDVKPHNVLICPPDSSKPWGLGVLTDLGSVTTSKQSIETRQQGLQAEEEAALKSSAPYRAPELTSVRPPVQICEKVDVWSLGCTMFSLAFGRSPFEVNNAVQRLGILNARYQYPLNNSMRECKYSDQYVQLINDMLELDPLIRYSISYNQNTTIFIVTILHYPYPFILPPSYPPSIHPSLPPIHFPPSFLSISLPPFLYPPSFPFPSLLHDLHAPITTDLHSPSHQHHLKLRLTF